jgi:hypothetical protein
MKSIALLFLMAVSVAIMPSQASGCEGSRLVTLFIGCIEVPCGDVVAWSMGNVDAFSGYIEPPEKNWRAIWMTGMWVSLLGPRDGSETLWVRDEVWADRLVTVGRVREIGEEFFVVRTGAAQFAMPADVPRGLDLLQALVAHYRSGGQCVVFDLPLPPGVGLAN